MSATTGQGSSLLGRKAIALAIGGAVVAFIVQMIFAGSYIGALHKPTPHDLPFGVVAPEPNASAIAQQIRSAAGGAIDPEVMATEQELRDNIDRLDVYGGVVVGADGLTLIVSEAAGSSGSNAITLFTQGYAAAQQVPLTIEKMNPLEIGDPRGLTSTYLVFAWVFGGYFCATVLTTVAGSGYRNRRHALLRIGLLAGYSIISGLGSAVIAGSLIDALPGHFWAIALSGAMTVFAVAVATMAVQLLLGVAGTIVAMIALVLIGNPSSGGVVLPEFLPGFWRAVGPWLPNFSGFQLLRNSVYFEHREIGRPLLMLAIYAIAGMAILLIFANRKRTQFPVTASPETELAIGTAASA
ncbi:MAG: ABC transporter permease [Thermomicrobiales bacterium]